jgi:drug/metabolite transporter (DMT)-like permease
MIFLALAIVCSTTIAVLFKLTEGRVDRIALLTVNYFAAVVLSAGLLAVNPPEARLAAEPGVLALGLIVGVLFIAGFALLSKAIGLAGMSLAASTMRLSVAVPFVASWLVWGEVPTAAQWIGLGAAGAAFMLLTWRPAAATTAEPVAVEARSAHIHGSTAAVGGILVLLFIVGGLVDTSFKAFEEEFAAGSSRAFFLLLVFGAAFVIGASVVFARRVRRGAWPQRSVIGWGIALGLANYGSAEFILLALAELPGTFVFPANNVAIVAMATLLGVAIWRERLSRTNWLGLALAAAALILLGH